MKIKLLIIIISGLSIGFYFYYQYYFIKTLMLSEIVKNSNDPFANLVVKIVDFDTGLTRNDIKHLKDKKDYWIGRMKEVEAIEDVDAKVQANTKLIADMMDDPAMNKVCNILLGKGIEFSIEFLMALD